LEPCKYGHDEVVEVLLAAGAEIHFIDADGDTALSVAKEEGHDRIVTLLDGKS
jgi:ankyrin repeat protein